MFDVESFKNTYPGWYESPSIEVTIFSSLFLSLFFFVSLWILGTCIKRFGSKLIPVATISIFDRIVRINNRKLDAKEKKDLAAELKDKIPRFDLPIDEFITDIDENKFKKSYANINLEFYRRNEDAREEYVLKEGYRYMPLEEVYHVIGLIYRLEISDLSRDWNKIV